MQSLVASGCHSRGLLEKKKTLLCGKDCWLWQAQTDLEGYLTREGFLLGKLVRVDYTTKVLKHIERVIPVQESILFDLRKGLSN